MRVTAGKVKGLKLKVPRSREIRPMTERARKALFDILGPKVEGARVLDLFCGTGAVGIEALSRGAKEAVFIDSSLKSLSLTKENLKKARFLENSILIKCTLPGGLKNLMSLGAFDILFITPPYGSGLAVKTLKALSPLFLCQDSIVVVEERVGEETPCETEILTSFDRRRYGQTELYFYRRK